MREFEIQAGEEKRIVVRYGSSIPEVIEFEADSMRPGETPEGTVEVRGSSWIIPKKPRPQPLAASNQVEKGAWDSSFSIWVIPDTDVRIRLHTSSNYRLFWIVIAAAILTVLAAGAIIVLTQI
jgi:hypothetical protein